MKKCIRNTQACIGRDCRELPIKGQAGICCREEIQEEKEIAQNIIDAIDICKLDQSCLQRISSKLSYGAHVINKNNEDELAEILPIVQRFSLLIYEFQEKILHDTSIAELTHSFAMELRRWFSYKFLNETDFALFPIQRQSILSDMNTIEMALGVCMIENREESLDELFF